MCGKFHTSCEWGESGKLFPAKKSLIRDYGKFKLLSVFGCVGVSNSVHWIIFAPDNSYNRSNALTILKIKKLNSGGEIQTADILN